jgi:hypothetical protein
LAVANLRTTKIGRVGLTVEMDETHIYNRKYNVGGVLISESVWEIGENVEKLVKFF